MGVLLPTTDRRPGSAPAIRGPWPNPMPSSDLRRPRSARRGRVPLHKHPDVIFTPPDRQRAPPNGARIRTLERRLDRHTEWASIVPSSGLGPPKHGRGGRRTGERPPPPEFGPAHPRAGGSDPVRRGPGAPAWSRTGARKRHGGPMRTWALRRCAPPLPSIRWRRNVLRPRRPVRPWRTGRSGRDASDPPRRGLGTGSRPGVLAHPRPRTLRVATAPAIPPGRGSSAASRRRSKRSPSTRLSN